MDYWQQREGSRTLHFSKYLQMYLCVICSYPKVSSTHFSPMGTWTRYHSFFHLGIPANTASSQMRYKSQERVCLISGLLYLIAKLRCHTHGLYLLPSFHNWLQSVLLLLVFGFSLKEIPDYAEKNIFHIHKRWN